MNRFFWFLIALIFASGLKAQEAPGYMLPPAEIIELVDAPVTPSMRISPAADNIVFIENPGLRTLSDFASEELRLGGIRFDPSTNGPSRASYGIGLSVTDTDGSNHRVIGGLPKSPRIRNLQWSPDGSHIAFTNTTDSGIELWVANIENATARRITGPVINDILGNTFEWLSDNKTLIYPAVVEARGPAPQRPLVADSPIVQESTGRRAAVRTYQDLLSDKYDEEIFDYYVTSQLFKVDLNGNTNKIGEPAVYWYFTSSPDGKYLLTNRIERPYSYIVPFTRFPQKFEVLEIENGNIIRLVADIPVADDIPQGFDAVRKGPRSLRWRADTPASLFWAEAVDGGDPAVEAEYRDQLFYLEAPFDGDPIPSLRLKLRFSGIMWGKKDFAIVSEYWRKDRRQISSYFNPEDPSLAKSVVFDLSVEDRYNHPGSFQMKQNEYGQGVLMFDNTDRRLILSGQGASPEGNMPFIDRYDIRTGKTERLWQCEAPWYEYAVRVIDPDEGLVITRRESREVNPNFFVRNIFNEALTQITDYPDPFPQLRDVEKEMIHYEREDGVSLSGTLYLPEGYNVETDGPLPTILWAYPREFISADAAGQVRGSHYTYTRLGATSPVMLVTQGYAVLDGASFPIVGEGDEEPNDSFIEQLVANAQAAIDNLVEMGVTDPDRVGVSGHSYGAFMTANLLAHSDLFATGVARSGAYNRSLTPFGFQAEERTYWQAPDIYHMMSPFSHADKISVPILLLHGADDNNSGTFPMQSERYYDALRGHGATVRLVMFPHEGHGYRARESILHMHWEWVQWFDKYLKGMPSE